MQPAHGHLTLLGLLLGLTALVGAHKTDQWMVNDLRLAVGYFRDMMGTGAAQTRWARGLRARLADNSSGVSPQCEREMAVLEAAEATPGNYTWIFPIQNSKGDFPEPGVFLGKRLAVGSYDLCRGVKPTQQWVYDPNNVTAVVGRHDFKMRYCLTRWHPQGDYNGYGEGTCVPKSCSREDVVEMMPWIPGIQWNSAYCGDVIPISENKGGIVALSVLALFVFLIVVSSLFDLGYRRWQQKKKDEEKFLSDRSHVNRAFQVDQGVPSWGGKGTNSAPSGPKKRKGPHPAVEALLSFSLVRNVPSMLQTTQRGYGCMNGIRVMAMTWVVLGHAWILDLESFSANYPANFLLYTRLSHQIINNGGFSVDTFFFLSGCLVMISFMKAAEQIAKRKDKVLSTIKFLGLYVFHRYWRLTPLYAALIMLNTHLWMYMGSGPLWPEFNGAVWGCMDNWWTNLLYVNNLFGTDKQCMGWSWYLPNDFQFFLILPLFGFVLFMNPTLGSIFLTLGWAGSLVCRIALVMTGRTDFNQLYSKPWSRFGTYAIGMGIGYIMYRTKCKVKLNKFFVAIGWAVAISLMLALVLGTWKRGDWNSDTNIAYTVAMRDAFALGVGWVVFMCCSGYGGLFNTFFSWQLWIPLAKLSYGSYLLHPIVSFLAMANRKELFYIQDITVIYQYFGTLVITMALAFAFGLIFEVPFIKLEKVILPSPKKPTPKPPAETTPAPGPTYPVSPHSSNDSGPSSPVTAPANELPQKGTPSTAPVNQEPQPIGEVPVPLAPPPAYREAPVDVKYEVQEVKADPQVVSDPPSYTVQPTGTAINTHTSLPPVEVMKNPATVNEQSTAL